jgi:hypothetical protein
MTQARREYPLVRELMQTHFELGLYYDHTAAPPDSLNDLIIRNRLAIFNSVCTGPSAEVLERGQKLLSTLKNNHKGGGI